VVSSPALSETTDKWSPGAGSSGIGALRVLRSSLGGSFAAERDPAGVPTLGKGACSVDVCPPCDAERKRAIRE